MAAKKIIIEQKIVREMNGAIHGPLRMEFDFPDDEKHQALRAMMSGLLTVAFNWNMRDFVFECMRATEEEVSKTAGQPAKGKGIT